MLSLRTRIAETGQRGFVITGDEAFLAPYMASLKDLPPVLKEARELTRDNPNQQRRLDEVEPLVARKLAELKHTVELRRRPSRVRGDAESGRGG